MGPRGMQRRATLARHGSSHTPSAAIRRYLLVSAVVALALVPVALIPSGPVHRPSAPLRANLATPMAGPGPIPPTDPGLALVPEWRALATSHLPTDRATLSPVLAYDAHDGYTLLYGGLESGVRVYDDTWAYQNASWKQLKTTLTPQLEYPAMAYDPVDGYVVLVGGAGPKCPTQCDEAWTWTFADGQWSQLNISGPTARVEASLAWDPALGELVLFGGNGRLGAISDTWTFVHGAWSQFSGSEPTARNCAALAYVPAAGGLVLFGGLVGAAGSSFGSDTWLFNGRWTQLYVTGPTARACAQFASEPSEGKGVLFGGFTSGTGGAPAYVELGDTWTFDGSTWNRLDAPGPSARHAAFMTFDEGDGYILMFDGIGCVDNCPVDSYPNDAWSFQLGLVKPLVNVTVTPGAVCATRLPACPAGTTEAFVNITLLIVYGSGPAAAPEIVAPTLSVLPWDEVRVSVSSPPVVACEHRATLSPTCTTNATVRTVANSTGFEVAWGSGPGDDALYVGNEWTIGFGITVAAPPFGAVPIYACTTEPCLAGGSGTVGNAFSALEFEPYGPGSVRDESLPFANITVEPPLSPSQESTVPSGSAPPPPPVATGVPTPVSVPAPVTVANPVIVATLLGTPAVSLAAVGAGVLGAGFARAAIMRRAIAQGQAVGTVVRPRRSSFEPAQRSDPTAGKWD